MAKYDVTAPNGQVYEIEAPDDATEEQVLAYAQQNFGKQNDPSSKPEVGGYEDQWAEKIPVAAGSQFENADNPSFFERLRRAANEAPTAMFGTDEELGQRITERRPGSQIVQDSQGRPIVQMPDGQRFYVNQPGLDGNDVLRFAGNVASYFPAGRISKLLAPEALYSRAAYSAAGSGATNYAGQKIIGRENADMGEMAFATGFGGAAEFTGPVLGWAWSKISPAARKSRQLAAQEMAKNLGIDSPSPQQIAELQPFIDEQMAGASDDSLNGIREFGLRYTQGQKTGNFARLSEEEALKQSPGGELLRNVQDQNRETVNNALDSIASKYTQSKTPQQAMERVATSVQDQAGKLKQKINEAYAPSKVSNVSLGKDSADELLNRIGKVSKEAGNGLNPQVTPASYQAMKLVDKWKTNIKNAKSINDAANNVENLRRTLRAYEQSTKSPPDKRIIGRMIGELDQWQGEAIDNALFSGDQNAVKAIKEGRALRAEYGKRFEGRTGDARVDKVITDIAQGKRTPQELVNMVLGVGQVSRSDAARIVSRIKAASIDNPEIMNEITGAQFMKMVTKKNGSPEDYGKIISNIAQMERESPELIKALYKPEDWAKIKRLAGALNPLVAKGDFAKSSGSTERFMRFMNTVGGIKGLGPIMEIWKSGSRMNQASKVLAPLKTRAKPVAGVGAYAGAIPDYANQ